MHFLTVLIMNLLISLSNGQSAIMVYKSKDKIIYAKSYTFANSEINYINCDNHAGVLNKEDVSIFEKSNVCLQVSIHEQVEVLKKILDNEKANENLVLRAASKDQMLALEKFIKDQKNPPRNIKLQYGEKFDIFIPSKKDPNVLESILP